MIRAVGWGLIVLSLLAVAGLLVVSLETGRRGQRSVDAGVGPDAGHGTSDNEHGDTLAEGEMSRGGGGEASDGEDGAAGKNGAAGGADGTGAAETDGGADADSAADSTHTNTAGTTDYTDDTGDSDQANTGDTDKAKAPAKELTWERPRFPTERQAERKRMVVKQMRDVKDAGVLQAMREVPRHMFMPKGVQSSAYLDRPLPIGHGQTISQPYIVAFMTEALKLKPGDRVLEIGTGSGYQAAVLSELTPHVYSIEIVKPLADAVKERLETLGYKTVRTVHADGFYGWKKYAPFDAIIVTCAATLVPPPLIRQLKEGGRMCIPVGGRFSHQELYVVTKKDGAVTSESVMNVTFVPLTRWKTDQTEE